MRSKSATYRRASRVLPDNAWRFLHSESAAHFFSRRGLGQNCFNSELSVDHRSKPRSPLDYQISAALMSAQIPIEIQNKIDGLNKRKFGQMLIYLALPLDGIDLADVDSRYERFENAWNGVYPGTDAAYAHLERVIAAVIQKKYPPPLAELTALAGNSASAVPVDPKARFHGCFMHQHEASLCEAVKLLQSLGVSPTQVATP